VTATCPVCGETFEADDGGVAKDYLVDHLTDAHGLISWAAAGRSATEVTD